ncbi:YtpR family tRNA-binding protein [Virgibacillus halophilus]|uniref:YtpR family tRNA-binding protein n=1 Tax=Tigheibacillus halophilus TaxID=361280 RepID=UPI00362BCE05
MDVFYNPEGMGDVLIVPVKEGDRYEIEYMNYGPVTKITDRQGELLGYNIFEASEHLSLIEKGKIMLSEAMLDEIRTLFAAHGLEDKLDFDLRPKFVVGYVEEKKAHENADKLSVCQVDVGDEMLQIVCGAPNIDQGQKVVVAKVGATMPSGMQIKPTTLRGVPSNGMICSQKELGLPNAPTEKGIYVLSEKSKAGEPFVF